MGKTYENKLMETIGWAFVICVIAGITLWSVYWNVSEDCFRTIFKIISIAFVIYGFFYPLRAIAIILTHKFIPTFNHEITIVTLFISGIIVGITCSIPIIITYIICNVLGLMTSPR